MNYSKEKFADYATPEEIKAVAAALRERLRQVFNDEAKRKSIKRALREIRYGQIPWSLADHRDPRDLLGSMFERIVAVFRQRLVGRNR
jgi:hypothetical protein